MPNKKREYLNTELECIECGHRFKEVVLNETHYHDGYVPYRRLIPKRALYNVRCPECGSPVKEAK
jgi:endogenous inhibitor of DNA gyrase (YacG/DUF329 family)